MYFKFIYRYNIHIFSQYNELKKFLRDMEHGGINNPLK